MSLREMVLFSLTDDIMKGLGHCANLTNYDFPCGLCCCRAPGHELRIASFASQKKLVWRFIYSRF